MKLGAYDGRFPERSVPRAAAKEELQPGAEAPSVGIDTEGVQAQLRATVESAPAQHKAMTPEQRELVNNRSTLRWVSTAIMDFYDQSGIELTELLRLWNKKYPEVPVTDFNGMLVECSVRILRLCSETEGAVAGAAPDRLRIMEEVHAMLQELTK